MQSETLGQFAGEFWCCVSLRTVGTEARPHYAQQDQSANMIEVDGQVRTPSDHMGLIAELEFSDKS